MLTIEEKRLIVWELKTPSTIVDVCEAEGTHLLAIDSKGHRAVLSTRESGVAIHRLDCDRDYDIKLDTARDNEPPTIAEWSPEG